jgi:hypothetical protein
VLEELLERDVEGVGERPQDAERRLVQAALEL